MNIYKALMGVCAVIPLCAGALNNIKCSTPDGFLSQGKMMLGDKNYTGAIDMFKHLHTLPATANMLEEADFLTAICHFEQGKECCIDELLKFIKGHPTSFLVPRAWATIGDFHFFNARYGDAAKAYANVGVATLDSDADFTVTYREGYALLRLAEWDEAKVRFDRLTFNRNFSDAGKFFQAYVDYAHGNHSAALEKFSEVKSHAELAAAARYYICQIRFAQKDFAGTISYGRKLLNENTPADFSGEMNRIVGESLYHEGNDADASKHLNEYINSCNGSAERTAQYIIGVLDYRNRDFLACIDHLSEVTEAQDALSQSAYLLIGQSYRKTGNLNSAAMAFEKAYNMPFDLNVQQTAFFNYALTQNDGGRTPFNRSIDIFEQFINKYPDSRYSDDVEDYLITAYINGKDFQRALTSISHIKSPSAKVKNAKQLVLFNLGVQSISNGKTNQAEKYFVQAYNLGNLDKTLRNECNLWIGECRYRSGRFAEAAKSQEAFLKGASKSNKNFALAHYNLGYSRFSLRNYAAAREAFDIAAKSSALSADTRADAFNRIADTYYYAKDYSSAAAFYEKAFKTNSSAGDYALYQRAMMQGLNKNHSSKIALLDELLRDFHNSALAPAAMLQKADAFVAMNNNSAAITVYEKLAKSFPSAPEARKGLLQMAITKRNMGNNDGAIDAYKKVISVYPASEEASVAAEDLKLIFADNGNLQQYVAFLNSIPNAPKIDVSEIDRLTFEAAEKAYMAEKSDITKMRNYLAKFPKGAYSAKAIYYIARYEYKKGNYNAALSDIDKVLSNNADAAFAEDALAMKADILLRKKDLKEAQSVYEKLLACAASHDNKLNANLGIMRTAASMEQYSKLEKSANALLSLGGLSPDEEIEATFNRAFARLKLKRGSEAVKDLTSLAGNTQSVYGARAAFELAQYHFNAGNMKRTEAVINDFIDAGTPHSYWLARAFILLADVCHKRGDVFEARQYLESLRKNYPGNDDDIFKMIDSRLNSWKSSNSSSKKK